MSRPIDLTPFDRRREPPKQNPLVMPLLWLWCWLATREGRLHIHRVNTQGLKPPFLVLATHHAFMDFYVTPLALFPHRANYVSELEGFEAYGEWKYRQIGCLGTRKFVTDLALVKNIKRIMDRKGILVLYPEARYANVGTSAPIPPSVGKLCKYLGVPVVTLNMKGNYLQSPIWNVRKRRGVPLSATLTQLFTPEEVANASPKLIQTRVEEALAYNEYSYQREMGFSISEPWRAEGLHLPLYQCPRCGQEFSMDSRGAHLFCAVCGADWLLREDGLLQTGEGKLTPIPQWYEWQRRQVMKELREGRYLLDVPVHVKALPNAVNFIDLGPGQLRQDTGGFTLTFTDYGETSPKRLSFPASACFSIHTEYDYRGKYGPCVTLSTPDNTYFLYPLSGGFNPTKIQFATEALWSLAQQRPAHPLDGQREMCGTAEK